MNARVSLALSVMGGFLLGWLVRGPGEPAPAGSLDGLAAPSTSRLDSKLRESQVKAGRSDDAGEADEEIALQVTPDALIALIESWVPTLTERIQLVQTDEPLAKLIEITEEEAQALNGFWDRLKPGLDAQRMANVKHQTLGDGGVWLGIEPFPEEGEKCRRDFLRSVHRVLGESRARVFLESIAAYEAFGKWGKTVGSGHTIHMFVQEDESLVYEIVEQPASADGSHRKWNTSTLPTRLAEMASAAGITLSPRHD